MGNEGSADYPVECYARNCDVAIIYGGSRDINTLRQAYRKPGLKNEKPAGLGHCRHGRPNHAVNAERFLKKTSEHISFYFKLTQGAETRKTSHAQRPALAPRVSYTLARYLNWFPNWSTLRDSR
jgi:hypothetical protein